MFDYIRLLKDKWTKPGQDIELISDEFDRQYTVQYYKNPPPGIALDKPKTPQGVKHWGLRTLWCYWIDRHLDLVEKVQTAWYTSVKSEMDGRPEQAAKDFVQKTMTNGDAAVAKFRFPRPSTSSATAPLPGEVGSSSSQESRYGMWGGNSLGKLGL